MVNMSNNKIRALYNDKTIRVYQAYNPIIAKQAVKLQTFGSAFKKGRMTWIKPSFFWMMYRCGWATKVGQEHVLAIDITIEGFLEILSRSTLSSYKPEKHESKEQWQQWLEQYSGRVQWDPERDYQLLPLDYRSIQIGLKDDLVSSYINDWIVKITDITEDVKKIYNELDRYHGNHPLLPMEKEFEIHDEAVLRRIF